MKMPNEQSVFENRLMLQMLSGAGASIAGPGSFAAGMNPMVQQNIAAQSQASLQNKRMNQMAAILLGKGLNVTSDDKGGITVKGENMEALSALSTPQENIGLRGEGGTAGVADTSISSTAPVTGAPANPQKFTMQKILSALGGGS
jgi:hypothetical protein